MSNKLLKKVLDDIETLPSSEISKLIKEEIAEKFIPTPKNLPFVDHINRNRSDNRISNLRWVSVSENNKNKSGWKNIKYEYFDELPKGAEPFTEYKGKQFKKLFRKGNDFYFDVGPQYRKVPVCHMSDRADHINFTDVNGKHIRIYVY